MPIGQYNATHTLTAGVLSGDNGKPLLRRILIFGNSGSGKSTLAKKFENTENLPHLDLDTVAWLPTSQTERMALADSALRVAEFTDANEEWVIEGCYSDLLRLVAPASTEVIFLNLPLELCIANARNRPWEQHKYQSKEAQDANLEMLIDWISQYETRSDSFSCVAHRKLFAEYSGEKRRYISNRRIK